MHMWMSGFLQDVIPLFRFLLYDAKRETERDGCGLCFGFQSSNTLCYISSMTNQSASVVEE